MTTTSRKLRNLAQIRPRGFWANGWDITKIIFTAQPCYRFLPFPKWCVSTNQAIYHAFCRKCPLTFLISVIQSQYEKCILLLLLLYYNTQPVISLIADKPVANYWLITRAKMSPRARQIKQTSYIVQKLHYCCQTFTTNRTQEFSDYHDHGALC